MKLLPMRIQTCLLGMTLDLSWKRISVKWPLKPRPRCVISSPCSELHTMARHCCMHSNIVVCDTSSIPEALFQID
jgi:hypothetical protein